VALIFQKREEAITHFGIVQIIFLPHVLPPTFQTNKINAFNVNFVPTAMVDYNFGTYFYELHQPEYQIIMSRFFVKYEVFYRICRPSLGSLLWY
jgi:hypothetical protein